MQTGLVQQPKVCQKSSPWDWTLIRILLALTPLCLNHNLVPWQTISDALLGDPSPLLYLKPDAISCTYILPNYHGPTPVSAVSLVSRVTAVNAVRVGWHTHKPVISFPFLSYKFALLPAIFVPSKPPTICKKISYIMR
jgi:hypothetical protein